MPFDDFASLKIPGNSPHDWRRAAVLTGVPGALAAAGADETDAAAITSVVTAVSASDGAKGVILPAASSGQAYTVRNTVATALLKVYPPTGGAIDGAATDAAVILRPGESRTFLFHSATVIKSLQQVGGVFADEITFTETVTAGVWTGTVLLPAGSTLLDVVINGVALWDSETSATMIVGDGTDPDGYFTAVDLKAADLLAGESLSFALAGGREGAYIANSQVSPRYAAAARSVIGVVTKVGDTGSAGRTRMTVYWSYNPNAVAATKV